MLRRILSRSSPRLSIVLTISTLAACATARERVYAAPTDANVLTYLEAAYDGRGQHVIVENRSTVEITVTSLHLRDCENIKNRCEVTRLRVPVRPGQRYRLAVVEAANQNQGYNFRYSWSWSASSALPPLPQ